MDTTVDATGQVPDHPGVHVAEDQLAGLGGLAGALDVVEDPLDLGTGEVGRQRQADALLVLVLVAATEFLDDLVGAGVLPDDRVVDRLTGLAVPHQSGLALVGDTDGLDVLLVQAGLRQRLGHDLADRVPDLHGVVLNPAGAREDLLVLLLAHRDDLA